ncbi:hypothetical protein D1BOALGB6SA_10529 [Olavius sp. associated proteobacterium Delta 1]|nr:hypothetical protein D1BOALGB6SA_10529 [Olavius sp. associated proteobacterium Delta 1]
MLEFQTIFVLNFYYSDFDIVSDFGFRYSDFTLPLKPIYIH